MQKAKFFSDLRRPRTMVLLVQCIMECSVVCDFVLNREEFTFDIFKFRFAYGATAVIWIGNHVTAFGKRRNGWTSVRTRDLVVAGTRALHGARLEEGLAEGQRNVVENAAEETGF